ncbi:MAG: ADP-ribose pyrophosphatase, partial [Arthrobacter sp.]|nr:ADP-ribose pyrophosphatase [Arthrobacter sp.]
MPGTPEATPAAKQVSDAPSPRRLLSTEKVYEGRIWDVVSDSFQLQETGEALTRDYIDH